MLQQRRLLEDRLKQIKSFEERLAKDANDCERKRSCFHLARPMTTRCGRQDKQRPAHT